MTMNTPKPPPGPPPRRGPRVVIKKADPNAAKAEKARRQNKIALWGMGLVACSVVAWAGWVMLGGLFRTHPPDLDTASSKEIVAFLTSDKFAKLSDVEKTTFSEGLQSLPDARRREVFGAQGLTSQDRRKMFENLRSARNAGGGGPGRGMSLQEMKDFFALPADQQLAKLDERIDEMESRMRDFAARRASPPSSDNATGGGRGFRRGGPPGGGGFAGPRPGGAGGSGGPRTGRRAPTEERTQIRTERRLDNSTPAERAYRTEYFRRMRERMQQRQAAKK